jgi:hypothetical protein
LDVTLRHALTALDDGLAKRFGVITGPGAFREWEFRVMLADVEKMGSGPPIEPIVEGTAVFADILANSQRSALRFLANSGRGKTAPSAAVVSLLSREASNVVAIASGLRDRNRLTQWMSTTNRAIITSKLRELASCARRLQVNLAAWLKQE